MKAERPLPYAGTIVKWVCMSVPLFKVVRANTALLDLLLNHLITVKVKWG